MSYLPASWHRPIGHPSWRACVVGWRPAEDLPTELRARLVALLLAEDWPVEAIAAHTRMTEFTTARIVDRVRDTRQLSARLELAS